MDNLAWIAERQHGIFTSEQARAAGISDTGEEHRRRAGLWLPAAVGVLRIPGAPQTWEQRLIALTLAAGPGAAASHRSAAALLGVPGFDRRGVLEVTTPRARRHRALVGTVHQSRILPDNHLTTVDNIVVTNTARTLVDLAGVLHPGRAERAIDNCLAARRVTLVGLHEVTELLAGRGRAGSALMRRLLEERGVGYVAPHLDLEAAFRDLVRSAGLEEPVRQLDTGDDRQWIGRVDFAYPRIRLVVELDSRRHHTALLDWESDRRRDNSLVAGGWRVIRITWDQIVNHPHDVVALLRRTGVTFPGPGKEK